MAEKRNNKQVNIKVIFLVTSYANMSSNKSLTAQQNEHVTSFHEWQPMHHLINLKEHNRTNINMSSQIETKQTVNLNNNNQTISIKSQPSCWAETQ